MPALSPHGAAKPPAPITSARELSSPTESAAAAAEEQPGLKSALDDESEHKATLKVAVEPAPQEPASPTVSSPASRRSSADLAGETSLGPLPRSGLVGDDDEDDDGTVRGSWPAHLMDACVLACIYKSRTGSFFLL